MEIGAEHVKQFAFIAKRAPMLKSSPCIYFNKDKDPSQPICLWKSSKCHFQFKVMTFLLHSSDLLEFLHKSINLVENIKTLKNNFKGPSEDWP